MPTEIKATIINPLGTYIKSEANYKSKRVIDMPLKRQKIIILDNGKITNGYYYTKVIYKREWYYGYILANHLKLI